MTAQYTQFSSPTLLQNNYAHLRKECMKNAHDMALESRSFLQSLITLPKEQWGMLIDSFALYLQSEYAHLAQDDDTWQLVKDEYETQAQTLYRFIDTNACDILDVTGLDTDMARILALKLCQWNGPGNVYHWRGSKRFVNRRITRINLEDMYIQMLPNYDDLEREVRQTNATVYYEPIGTPRKSQYAHFKG